MALQRRSIVAFIFGLQLAAGFHSPALQRHSPSALSAANNDNDGFSLDRRSAIATTSAAVLTSLSIADPANALFPVGAFASRPRRSSSKTSSRTIPTWQLDGGVEFPILALNTAGLSTEETLRAIDYAQNEGINHIDFH
eukprot:CAMPEP_0201706690 /NCGR_PEP_ID=MMETSP0578-20130828/49534_1 /ASSEMBLY_ACC=CAM_ASM_000663 /TAXON_ID=267565 /ORGANISM="Skeletonema grethea, Strain CCMP 1804" /LENGTH=138 /DNA_ID=CAMNT_0048195177 /DNA_START=11 /DNA_END=424 /DNA_ORIENTATION=+